MHTYFGHPCPPVPTPETHSPQASYCIVYLHFDTLKNDNILTVNRKLMSHVFIIHYKNL